MTLATDASTAGLFAHYSGSPSGGPSLIVGAPNRSAVLRSATNDHLFSDQAVTIGTGISALSAGAVAQWTIGTGNEAPLIGVSDAAGNAVVQLAIDSGHHATFTVIGDDGTGATVTGATVLLPDATYDIIGDWDGTDLNVYVDGIVDGTNPLAGPLDFATPMQVFIGATSTTETGNLSYDGTLAETFLASASIGSDGAVAYHAARGVGAARGAANAPAPTGTTSDVASGASLSAVQAAISGAAAGTTLVFPADTDLDITTEIELADGVSLYGLPGAKLTAAQTAGTNCFHASGISNVSISGFVCDGGIDGGGGTSINAFLFVEANCDKVGFEWCDFQNNFNQSDLYMFNSDNTFFWKNRCLANEFQPVSCHHTDGAHDHTGLFITDNSIAEYKRMAIECLINIQGGYHVDRNDIAGQDVPPALGGGIAMSLVNDYGENGPGTPNDFGTVIGNNVTGNTVPLELNLENMTVSGNSFDTDSGMFVGACPGSTIDGNDLAASATDVFQEDGGYDGSEWIGTNTVNGSSSTGWSGHGPYGAEPTVYAASDPPGGAGGDIGTTVRGFAPLVYYRLGELGATVAVDASGNGHDGLYMMDGPVGVAGLVSGDLDSAVLVSRASSDYVIEGDQITPGTISAFTLGIVLKPRAMPASAVMLLGLISAGLHGLFLVIASAGQVEGAGEDDVGSVGIITGSGHVSVGTTTDLILAWDGTTTTLYIDGAVVGTPSTAWTAPRTISDTLQLLVGIDPLSVATHNSFDGTVDEAFISLTHGATSGEASDYHDARVGSGDMATAVAAMVPDIYYRLGDLGAPAPQTFDTDLLDTETAILPAFRVPGGSGGGGTGGGGGSGTPPLPPPPTPLGQTTRWDVQSCPMDDTLPPYGYFPDAVPLTITWNYNTPDTAAVGIPFTNPALPTLDPDLAPPRELKVFRNGINLFTGKPWTRRGDSTSRMMVHSCSDPTAYLQHRYVGNASRNNYLENGDFEQPTLAPWTMIDPGLAADANIRTDHVLLGTQSVRLNAATVAGAPYFRHRNTFTAGSAPLRVFLTAWYYIATYDGPPPFGVGILLKRLGATGHHAWNAAGIDQNPEIGVWKRLETWVKIPPGATETLETRLYCVHGSIYFDACTLTIDTHLGWGDGVDQGVVIQDVVNYLQGKGTFGALAPEKSDLFLRAVMPVTGVENKGGLRFSFADHRKGFEGGAQGGGVLDHYLNSVNGIDWRFEPVGRTLRGYFPGYGTDRSTGIHPVFTYRKNDEHPELDGGWGIRTHNFADTLEQAANQITELGGWGGNAIPGDPTREEGGYSNPASLGGLTLELVESAPQGTPVGQLNERAQARGHRFENPLATPQIVVVEERDPVTGLVPYPLIGVLFPGDFVRVDIIDGAFVFQRRCRIVSITLDCQTEELTITFNPVPE